MPRIESVPPSDSLDRTAIWSPTEPRTDSRHGITPMTPTTTTTAALPALSSPAREMFLAAVRTADLFAAPQLARAEASVPANVALPADAARAMITAGFLTKFQAERLLAGRTDGFHLGPYIILEQIGRGAMGRVYKARHRTMNRSVAVKVLNADLTRTAAARQTFQKEVRAAAQLNHPNVVTAFDANEVAERFYVVLEFVDGPSLETLVKERGPLPVAEACELIRQAAAGLEHAHARRTVHHALKPANLLITRPSKSIPGHLLKVADFGIGRLNPAGNAADYLSPEQCHNPQGADYRADLYALGAVFYFLLAGRVPFPGGTAEDKARRHLWEQPVRIEHFRRDLPVEVAALVHQLLAKDPNARPFSAGEVADILDSLSGGQEAVCFELPAMQTGPYSFVGQLSGGHAIPMATAAPEPAPGSGVYTARAGSYPGAAATGVATPPPAPKSAVETSPWEQITVADCEEVEAEKETRTRHTTRTTRARRARRRKAGVPSWMVGGLAASMLVLCLVAVGVLVKVMGK